MKVTSLKKRGVTVAMATTMILIIALMTMTITIAVVKTVKSSNLKAFATELSIVQNTIQEAAFTGSINEYLMQDVTLNISSVAQFEGETVTENSVLLHVLNLEALGIGKSMYGTGKNGVNDYYAVSIDTLKVYYIAGYDDGNKVYYALTEELVQILNGENKAQNTKNVIFKANSIDLTNTPVTVTVKVPASIDITTVSVTTNNTNVAISTLSSKDGYNECIVNTGNVKTNYTVTVKYTADGTEKTETYRVANYIGAVIPDGFYYVGQC